MRNVVSLSTYLKSYDITREDFDKEVEKDKDFYDKYIEWGSKKDGSDTVLSPKALDRLGEAFNDSVLSEGTDTSPKETDKDKKEDTQMDMSQFMDKPVEAPVPTVVKEEVKEKTAPAKDGAKKKKKSKLNITKQFIQEHGQANVDCSDSLKQLRKFLMNDGSHKVEEVALMTDEEVQAAFGKDFYVIDAPEETYIIKRSSFVGIMSDVFVVGKE